LFERRWTITQEVNMKKLILIFLLLFSVNGYCGWFKVGESDSTSLFIEDSKITKKDKFIRIWSLYSLNVPQKLPNGEFYHSYVLLKEIDCVEDKSRDLSTTLYQDMMGKGKVIYTYDEISNWSFSRPGTLVDSLVQFSCGFKNLK
jgi:hypothetical protein